VIPVLSREQMRAFDAHAIETCKVPSVVLMENAGRGAADAIEREVLGARAVGRRVAVVCGTGNNGGDGFVVARHLLVRGAVVDVWLAGDEARMTPDCRANHAAFVGVGGHVTPIPLGASTLALLQSVESADAVVDALFGTGLDRPIAEPLASVVNTVNAGSRATVALDVPSGMNADTGAAMGATVRARVTVTFAHRKLGHVTPSGARLCGDVCVADIGVPPTLRPDHAASLVELVDVRGALHARAVDAHKYRAGHVAIFAGSAGKIGASLLCARAALRGGAGAATIVTWPDAASALDARVLEIMTAHLAARDSGPDARALETSVDRALAHKRAVVIGPGFGTDDRAKRAVAHVLATYKGPIVADADAISMHAGDPEAFAPADGRAILTPHAGELARLLGRTSDEIESNRFAAAREAAVRTRSVVLLKGAHTIVATPDGRAVVNPTGNPALATAGSGDVLSGLAGALACTLGAFEAAWCAAYMHGAAGDAWAARHGDRGLLASEIADELPAVLASVLRRG
jgi:NAD(P)H-hydrate epimerase